MAGSGQKKKIVYTGAGKGAFVSLFQSLCLERIKDATHYEQTKRFVQLYEQERKLVEEGWAEPWGPFTKGKKGKKGPPKIDADLRIDLQDRKVVVTHRSGKRKVFTLDLQKFKSFAGFEKAVVAMVRSVQAMLKLRG